LHYVKQLNNPINSTLPQAQFITKVGTLDYDQGLLTFNSLYVNFYDGAAIKIFAKPADRDFAVPSNTVLTIISDEIHVTANPVRL
jgi:hypothetical protein